MTRQGAQVVVVTGATGHLGTVLVQELVRRGEEVRYVTRSGVPPGLQGLQAAPAEAELFDVARLTQVFSGATVVYHGAARISLLPGDEAELHRVNVEGTRCVLQAARAAGVQRLVHVGSVEAFPLDAGPYPITESGGFDPEHTVMEYGRSKALGMQVVLDAVEDGLDAVICCPTGFVGPHDYRHSPMGQVVLDFLRGKLPAYVGGGFDFVDVRDVAMGVLGAAISGRRGQAYLLSGRYATVPEIMTILEELSGVRKPSICLPIRAIMPFMPLVEAFYRISGHSARFTRSSLRLLSLGVRVDYSLARSDFGYSPRPLEVSLADTVEWFRENGFVETTGE